MICRLQRNITKSCGYQLPTITEMYFLNYGDLNGYTTDTYDDCEFINSIDYDDRFYKVEGTNVSYTDSLVISDYQKYREKRLTFNIVGKDDACRLNDYTMIATGRYVVLLKVDGQWLLAGFANGMEADSGELSTENDFYIELAENSIMSSLPVDEALAESIIHNEQRRVKARLYYTNGREEIVYSNGDSDTTLNANEIPADGSSSKLQRVVIDNIVTSVESGIFSGRSALNSVQLPSGLTAIPDEAFFQCSSLRNIVLPSGVTSIGGFVFGRAALDEIELPNGLITIGEYAFDTTNLVGITIPSTVTSIGDYAFSSNIYLKRIVFTGSTAPSITTNTFGQMANLTEIYVPCGNETYNQGNWEDVETKEEMTFELHTGLITYTLCGYDYVDYAMVREFIETQQILTSAVTSITIGDYVKEIDEYAFDAENRLNNIQEITLGKNVELIEDLAFYTQENIESITIYNETPPVISSLSDLIDTGGTSGDNILIFVPSGSVTTYKEADGWEENEEQIFPIGYVAKNYFKFVALEDNCNIAHYTETDEDIYYSYDGITWNLYTDNSEVIINSGESVMWKSIATEAGSFGASGRLNVEGNVMSLIFGDNFEDKTDLTGHNNAFYSLFSRIVNRRHYPITGLTSAENLILPATTLSQGCYQDMFYGCTSLTSSPELPATTLSERCYQGMFDGCTSLTNAPDLPATTLANYCYYNMFQNCTSLTSSPELSSTTLANYCYQQMFLGCTSLNYVKMLATTNLSATDCLDHWVDGVSPTGTFVKAASASLPTGTSGIPSGWTIITA